jgi:hypothetical protein
MYETGAVIVPLSVNGEYDLCAHELLTAHALFTFLSTFGTTMSWLAAVKAQAATCATTCGRSMCEHFHEFPSHTPTTTLLWLPLLRALVTSMTVLTAVEARIATSTAFSASTSSAETTRTATETTQAAFTAVFR